MGKASNGSVPPSPSSFLGLDPTVREEYLQPYTHSACPQDGKPSVLSLSCAGFGGVDLDNGGD